MIGSGRDSRVPPAPQPSRLPSLSSMDGVVVVISAVLGLAIGSFLNVVIWRVPRKVSVVRPPSHCPQCETPISPRDNVPVLSWLLLSGKCRHCKNPIPVRYPLVEAGCGVLFAAVAARFGCLVGAARLPGPDRRPAGHLDHRPRALHRPRPDHRPAHGVGAGPPRPGRRRRGERVAIRPVPAGRRGLLRLPPAPQPPLPEGDGDGRREAGLLARVVPRLAGLGAGVPRRLPGLPPGSRAWGSP